MSTNENWTKVKYSYVCGSCGVGLREGDLAIMLDGEILCEDCALGRYGTVPCMIHERKPRRIYYPKDYPELANGIYRFGKVHGMLLMMGCIEHGDKAAVKKAVEAGEAVLEKRSEGLMIRFPGKLICPADKIDLDDIEYDDVNYLFAGGYSPDMKLICSEGRAIGICAMNRSEAYKVSFTCYERGAVLHSEEELALMKEDKSCLGELRRAVRGFTQREMLDYFNSRLIGQQAETGKIVYLFYEYLLAASRGEELRAPNWVLTAPSGCGKTEVYRILRDFFKEKNIDIPVLQLDLSQFSDAGYKGREATEIIDEISEASEQSDGTAIVFLDEADKKFCPSIGMSGMDHNAAAQANLLTIIEGSVHAVKKRGKPDRSIDTGKTMFVLMGAFQSIRDSRQKKQAPAAHIGFGSRSGCTCRPDSAECFYSDVTLDDMISFGMLEELAGRMMQVINLHRLSEEDMRMLIEDKARLISKETGFSIELAPEAVDAFLAVSYTNLGIRSIVNRIRTLVCEAVSRVYFDSGFDRSSYYVKIFSLDKASAQPLFEDESGSLSELLQGL